MELLSFISILIDIVFSSNLIVKFFFSCYDKLVFWQCANEIGVFFDIIRKSEGEKGYSMKLFAVFLLEWHWFFSC